MSEQLSNGTVYVQGTQQDPKEEISFKLIEHLGVLRSSASGWTRELNIVAWCGRPPKYDIREWTPDHKKSTRGITLTEYEMGRICEWVSERMASNAACRIVSPEPEAE
ncbi:MAG: hypothetical protein IKX89_04800 [Firmicutes bacterium]|nr:hypothetical protein [Bacillota bacterium]